MSSDRYTKDAISSLSDSITKLDKRNRSTWREPQFAEQLNTLAEACSVAPFGRGSQAVVDDTYRRAGKLDLPNFAIPFEPEGTALGAGIRECVLGGAESGRPVRFELYKLNVYGECGFFKARKDTPRGGAMFGSLVLVYPTVHSGGALVFRHRGEEWTFNSAAAVYQDGSPALAYAAFYSDVEHEVLPVTSGYRVTITYNLHFDDANVPQPTSGPELILPMSNFAKQLHRVLEDPQFMPSGGYLGFALHHAYPIERSEKDRPEKRDVRHLIRMLKGADAMVLRAAQGAGLSAQVRVAYDTEYYDMPDEPLTVLTTKTIMGGEVLEDGLWSLLHDPPYYGVLLWPEYYRKYYQVERAVHWVTPRTGAWKVKETVTAYGNEPVTEYCYSELCLIVAVGEPGARTAKGDLVQENGGW
ncbi:hypothetical protein PENSPDRAFT_759717 [Peniophora sp. CONT]|nr:hypothetical protein PENSPDRAFT_759717 [Peniophora sp. CONT]